MSLVFRNEQIESLEQSRTDDFIVRPAAKPRADYAEDVEHYTGEELYDEISEGVERVEGYGLKKDSDVSGFVKLLFTIAWHFDEYPLFYEILTEELYEPYQKMPYLFESATDDDWEEAAAFSDKKLDAEQNVSLF
jgi:hypothetical protein